MIQNTKHYFIKIAGLAITYILTGCHIFTGNDAEKKKPNIVYVLTDQWRAQATGYAGDPNVKTPNLDALAIKGINFENAVSVCPVCTPYRASLLTGRYPLSTGMFLNDLYLPAEELCMAEMFLEAGYETAYIGKWHLDGHGRNSFIPKERRQGFDYWKVLECTHNYNNSQYYAGDDSIIRVWPGYDAYAQTKDAQEYIRDHANKENPFILMVSYGGPHFPEGQAPEELRALYPIDSIKLRPNIPEGMRNDVLIEAQGYYAHCTALDSCVGELQNTVKETGISENTIFVFTSDHGEMLGSQGQRPWQKQGPWDESIRVPFLLQYPKVHGNKGYKVKAPINTPDILPTLLALAKIKIPYVIEGEDLSRMVLKENLDEDRAALFMSVYPFDLYSKENAYRGVRTSRYTYVRSSDGPWLLFDNELDPYQMKNLVHSEEYEGTQKELEEMLQAKLQKTVDEFFPKQHYLEEWGYVLNEKGNIPSFRDKKPDDFRVQSPAYKQGYHSK